MAPERSTRRIGRLELPGDLAVPESSKGLVIFAHGSGSSRLSPRNMHVAGRLSEAGLATLLFDLLTEEEALDRSNVFNIELLGNRMVEAITSAGHWTPARGLPIGLFGASTGAAAALVAAATMPDSVAAVVSRGGRPDLALNVLDRVRTPTLLIVGGHDEAVIEMNETAMAALNCEKRLEIIPGATDLFEEAGTLDQVVDLARDWFLRHLQAPQV